MSQNFPKFFCQKNNAICPKKKKNNAINYFCDEILVKDTIE